jgi:hypothetical protein
MIYLMKIKLQISDWYRNWKGKPFKGIELGIIPRLRHILNIIKLEGSQ